MSTHDLALYGQLFLNHGQWNGVHMLGVYPKFGLVMVHRVDTEADEVKFKADDLYPIISMIHGARIEQSHSDDEQVPPETGVELTIGVRATRTRRQYSQ